jgi:hypothetical protein
MEITIDTKQSSDSLFIFVEFATANDAVKGIEE